MIECRFDYRQQESSSSPVSLGAAKRRQLLLARAFLESRTQLDMSSLTVLDNFFKTKNHK